MNPVLADTILENLLDGVLIVNQEGRIIYANNTSKSIFSNGNYELVGEIFGYPVNPGEVQEIDIMNGDQLATVQMLPISISWNQEKACLLSIRDITQLKRIAQELEVKKHNLENMNLELEQYASLASHDLKEPVRKIMIFTQRLMQEPGPAEAKETMSYLKKILQSAERMQSLISGIAEYSRYRLDGVVELAQVDLGEVIEEVLSDLELIIAEKKAVIGYEVLPTIRAIRIQMHQLFLNLISNAIKYSREGVAPVIHVACRELDDQIEFTISDNGIGFDHYSAGKVFQPFHRLTNAPAEGSGIGLAICRKIVIAHGGDISVESKPGKGSRFLFSLSK